MSNDLVSLLACGTPLCGLLEFVLASAGALALGASGLWLKIRCLTRR